MRRKYIGDANDCLKGRIHEVLAAAQAVHHLHAVPMTTERWKERHWTTYAGFLRLGSDRVVAFEGFDGDGERYFGAVLARVPTDADLLIDPDTGIRSVRARSKHLGHVLVSELRFLLDASPSRLLLVYDESWNRKVTKGAHVRKVGRTLAKVIGPTVAYDAGRGFTMFITGRDGQRVDCAHEALLSALGPAVRKRVRCFRARSRGPTVLKPELR